MKRLPHRTHPLTKARPIDHWLHKRIGPHTAYYTGQKTPVLIATGDLWNNLLGRKR